MKMKIIYSPDELKGKTANLKEDFYTDDAFSYCELLKKDTHVYINGNETDGTCYVEYLEKGFIVHADLLNIKN